VAITISRRCGAAATCFATPSRVPKFGLVTARRLLRRRPRPRVQWHLDELVVRIARERRYLWCAVCRRPRERVPRHKLM
jgi:hypothetical protein